jgi:hypothetical protein
MSYPREGDFNLDGKPDLAVGGGVLLGNGDGTFAARMDYTTGTDPMSVAVGDFNLDSKPDIAVANNAWTCFQASACPAAQPAYPTACSGALAAVCTYGSTHCGCDASGVWVCDWPWIAMLMSWY